MKWESEQKFILPSFVMNHHLINIKIYLFFLEFTSGTVSHAHKTVMIQPDLKDEWSINLMRSADLGFVPELLSGEQTFKHFQARDTNLYEIFFFLSSGDYP